MVVVLRQGVEPGLPVAERIVQAVRAIALPGLLAGSLGRAARVLDALGAVGTGPAGVAEALVSNPVLVGAEAVLHAAAFMEEDNEEYAFVNIPRNKKLLLEAIQNPPP